MATLRQRCKIIYRIEADEVVEVDSQILDVYATDKADFLKLKDNTIIRLNLNTIWSVQPQPGLGVIKIIQSRFLSFTMVLGIGFLQVLIGEF